jgi:hypothetical protein
MSLTTELTIGFSVMITIWFLVVTGFAIDDVAVEKAISAGRANLVSEGSSGVNDTTAGTFAVSNVKDISFIRRFAIIVNDMPWWFNIFVGLVNGFGLFMLTLLWILKVIHGDG